MLLSSIITLHKHGGFLQLFVNNVINKTEGIKMNLSWVLDLAENVLPLTGDSLLDSFLFYGIGVASFRVAWSLC